jgi:hypothetical protein
MICKLARICEEVTHNLNCDYQTPEKEINISSLLIYDVTKYVIYC